MNQKNVIAGAIVAVVVIGAGILYFTFQKQSQRQPPEREQSQPPETSTVSSQSSFDTNDNLDQALQDITNIEP